MLGMWISVDPKRQFASPYLYAGNGMNPINIIDLEGEASYQVAVFLTNKEIKKDADDFNAIKSGLCRRLIRGLHNPLYT